MRSRSEQQARRDGHLAHLMTALRSIAKNHCLDNPDRAALIVKNRLIRRIQGHKVEIFANWYYDLLVEKEMHKFGKPIDWVYCLVRHATNQQTKGRLRGSNSLTWRECMEEAAKIKTADQLTPVERRAVEIVRGARPKPRKNVIERRAIRLAASVQSEWFPKQVPLNRTRMPTKDNFELDQNGLPLFHADSIQLTAADIISVAGPIIQEFAKQEIRLGQPMRNGRYTDSFEVLFRVVCAYATHQATRKSVNRQLNRVRHEFPKM